MFKSRIAVAALIAATVAGCDKTTPPISEARPVRTVAVEQGAELAGRSCAEASVEAKGEGHFVLRRSLIAARPRSNWAQRMSPRKRRTSSTQRARAGARS